MCPWKVYPLPQSHLISLTRSDAGQLLLSKALRWLSGMSPLLKNWWAVICIGLYGNWGEVPGGETRAVWDKSMVSWWQVQAGWGGLRGPLSWLSNRDQMRSFPSPTSCLRPQRKTEVPAPDLVPPAQRGCCGPTLPAPALRTGADRRTQLLCRYKVWAQT